MPYDDRRILHRADADMCSLQEVIFKFGAINKLVALRHEIYLERMELVSKSVFKFREYYIIRYKKGKENEASI